MGAGARKNGAGAVRFWSWSSILELKINIKFGAEILSWSKIEKMELYLIVMDGTAKLQLQF